MVENGLVMVFDKDRTSGKIDSTFEEVARRGRMKVEKDGRREP